MDIYRQLLQSLDFVQIPTTLPDLLFGDDIYRAQAAYIRAWLRRNPQSGKLRDTLRLAATSLEQLAAFQFRQAEANMQKAVQQIQHLPEPISGQPHHTLATSPSRISSSPHLKQPGRVTLAGAEAYVWVHTTSLELSVADPHNPYQVTEGAIQSAQQIEPLLLALTEQMIDPPLDNKYCICPKYYPEVWETQS